MTGNLPLGWKAEGRAKSIRDFVVGAPGLPIQAVSRELAAGSCVGLETAVP